MFYVERYDKKSGKFVKVTGSFMTAGEAWVRKMNIFPSYPDDLLVVIYYDEEEDKEEAIGKSF